MLLTAFSWILISIILLTFGETLLMIYCKLTKRNELYSILDKIFIGMVSIIIPLSINTIFFPSNHYFLLACAIFCLFFWILNKEKFTNLINKIKQNIYALSKIQIVLLTVFLLMMLIACSWSGGVYDSMLYHYQNIRWNEEYGAIPGLAVLNDRYAFNSNFFLLSSIFTFRFILGDALYPITSLSILYIGIWTFGEIFNPGYKLVKIIIAASFIVFFTISLHFILDTSTDLLPNVIAFYLIVRLLLNKKSLKSNYLLYFTLPIFLLTCKISFLPFCILNLYIIYLTLSKKDFKTLVILISISLLVIVPWLIKNVIISGYLVYPILPFVFFEFDWALTEHIARQQKEYIQYIGDFFYTVTIKGDDNMRDPKWIASLARITIIGAYISLVISFITLIIKRKQKDICIYWIAFLAILSTIIIWRTNGPDYRFIPAMLTLPYLFWAILVLDNKTIKIKYLGNSILIAFVLFFSVWTLAHLRNQYYFAQAPTAPSIITILYKPYSIKQQLKAKNIKIESLYEPFELNNGVRIFVAVSYTYDMLASIPKEERGRFIDFEDIEARGFSIKDGFRLKSK